MAQVRMAAPDREDEILGGPQIDVRREPSPDGASFEARRSYQAFAGACTLVEPGEAAALHRFLIKRTPEDAARTGIDHLTLSLHLMGSYSGVVDGVPFLAQPGDLSFLDFGRRFEFEVSAFRTNGLTVPKSALPESMRDRDLGGLIAPAGSAAPVLGDVAGAAPRATRHGLKIARFHSD